MDEQNDDLFDHIQGAQGAIESFIDLEEEESGDDSDFDPRSGDYFTDFAQLPESSPQFNSLIRENISDVGGIKEGAMAFPEMLVARGRRLGGLVRARVVGSSSGIQIHNDGLPPGPNASRARADHTMASRGHAFGVTPFHNTLTQNTRQEQGDIPESVDVNTMNGTCLDSMGTKL